MFKLFSCLLLVFGIASGQRYQDNENVTKLLEMIFDINSACGYDNRVHLPTIIMVLTSWVSFWLPRREGTRPLLPLMALLFVGWSIVRIGGPVPKTSCHSSTDTFFQTSFVMIFVALLQNATVSYVSKVPDSSETDTESSLKAMAKKFRTRLLAKTIDGISRIAFPLVYLVFNIFYWTTR